MLSLFGLETAVRVISLVSLVSDCERARKRSLFFPSQLNRCDRRIPILKSIVLGLLSFYLYNPPMRVKV